MKGRQFPHSLDGLVLLVRMLGNFQRLSLQKMEAGCAFCHMQDMTGLNENLGGLFVHLSHKEIAQNSFRPCSPALMTKSQTNFHRS